MREATPLGEEAAAGATGPDLPGPFAVGRYARKLQEELRRRARVLLVGEVTGLGRSKVQAYFELRDSEGAVPCAIWLTDLEKTGLPEGALRDGAEVVIAGGPDYYPGGAQSSPSFAFRATHVRLAGEGDLLARLGALRKQLRAEGLFELQKQLARPLLPKTTLFGPRRCGLPRTARPRADCRRARRTRSPQRARRVGARQPRTARRRSSGRRNSLPGRGARTACRGRWSASASRWSVARARSSGTRSSRCVPASSTCERAHEVHVSVGTGARCRRAAAPRS